MSVAQTVTGQLNFNCNFQQTQTTNNINSNGSSLNQLITQTIQYINSTGVQYGVDQLYAYQFTLASTTATVHFQTSTADDPFGNTLAMLRIREFIVQNVTTTLGYDLTVEASSSNGIAWLPVAANTPPVVRAGGILRISDPLSFGSSQGNYITSTSDGVTFNSGSHTITFNVLVLGCSVA